MQKTKKKVIGQSWENSVTEGRAVLTSEEPLTAWKVSKYGVFLVSIFPHFDWIRRYSVKSLRIQYKCAKIRTRKLRIWTFFTQFLREPVPTRTLMCSSMASRWGKLRILEPVKHLTKNTQYGYNWTILANTSKHARAIENLKAIHIALLKLSLNDQLKSRNCSFLEMG